MHEQDAVGETDVAFSAATWRTRWNIRVVFALLCESMTSYTTPEVHNVSNCCQKRTQPGPQVACSEIWVKFTRVVFEICEPTDRQTNRRTNKQTYRHADHNTSHHYRGAK